MSKEYKIEGMTCNHCKAKVEKAVLELEGISAATAIPSENKLIIEGETDELTLKSAIERLGYAFKGSIFKG